MKLSERVDRINTLFNIMHGMNASYYQITKVNNFRKQFPILDEDLDFCFEVLAGKHKVGYTYICNILPTTSLPHLPMGEPEDYDDNYTIRQFYDEVIRRPNTTDNEVVLATMLTPLRWQRFFYNLVNREFKLGYTNRNAMVTDKHCMLAKTYPEFVREQNYYIQEKLNGNRCIAYYEDDKWKFTSRSQTPKDYPFDMTGLDITRIYDGEVMTRNKMGNRDFAATSGLANSKYGDKSKLVYFIYDILDDTMTYTYRLQELQNLMGSTSDNVQILKTLDLLWINPNPEYNWQLDAWLDKIVAQGGEGVMLRDPDAPYHHSRHSGDRKPYLLKYKKTKTCDLRVVGFNEGKGKYEGMIGSFICESDDGSVRVNVAGMTDMVRATDPNFFIGKIIEVTYFDSSKSKNKTTSSLQFPRMKGIRYDKDETSMF